MGNNFDTEKDNSRIIHPHYIFLALLLASITVLFISFSAAFVYTRVESNMPAVELPFIFFLTTLLLLGSSLSLRWAKKAYLQDQTENYQTALILTIILTLIFMVGQFFGWKALFENEMFIGTNNSISYLYLISGLHFAHVIAGLPFLMLFLHTARKRMKEPVSVLVYFSDPEKRMKLRLLTIYWHFLDALWIYLVLFFFINSIFS